MGPETLNTTRDINQPLTQDARGGGNIANVPVSVSVDLGKETRTLVIILALALVVLIGICSSIIGMDIAERGSQSRQWMTDTNAIQREWQRDTKAINDHADDLGRKYRMAELKYDELNLTLRRAGISVPNDLYGVGANLDPDSFRQPSHIDKHRK